MKPNPMLANSRYLTHKALLAKSDRVQCGVKRHYRNPFWVLVGWFMESVCAMHEKHQDR